MTQYFMNFKTCFFTVNQHDSWAYDDYSVSNEIISNIAIDIISFEFCSINALYGQSVYELTFSYGRSYDHHLKLMENVAPWGYFYFRHRQAPDSSMIEKFIHPFIPVGVETDPDDVFKYKNYTFSGVGIMKVDHAKKRCTMLFQYQRNIPALLYYMCTVQNFIMKKQEFLDFLQETQFHSIVDFKNLESMAGL